MVARIITLSAAALFLISGASISAAQTQDQPQSQQEEISYKDVTGTISSLSSNFIALETGVDSKAQAAKEYAFNLDKNVKLAHRKSLKEFRIGDTVKIDYQEKIRAREDGRKIRTTLVKMITFLKPAPKDMAGQENTLVTPQESEPLDGSLPLKGIKGR